MAFELYRYTFPAIAASQTNAGAALQWTASALERQVIPIASSNLQPIGVALASAGGTYLGSGSGAFALTQACPVVDAHNTIKVTAIASLGVGAKIGVASTNGGLAPVAAASGSVIWQVGESVGPAVAGEIFGLYVNPRQLSGMP